MWSNSSRRQTSVFVGTEISNIEHLNKRFMIEIGCESPSIMDYTKVPNPGPSIMLPFIASNNEIMLQILHIWLRSVKNDINQFSITGSCPRATKFGNIIH